MNTNLIKTMKLKLVKLFSSLHQEGKKWVNDEISQFIATGKEGNLEQKLKEVLEQKLERKEEGEGGVTKNVRKKDKKDAKETKKEQKEAKNGRKRTTDVDKLGMFLQNGYDFRYNVLIEQTEFRVKGGSESSFRVLDERELNTICIEAQKTGLRCWDRDVARYIHSSYIAAYHPFKLFLQELPVWDGKDRLTDLAQRVSTDVYWVGHFHRWMLALTAQWMGLNDTHANSVAPLLISTSQGLQKSTFCKSLLPPSLQGYYTDQLNLSASGMENKLAQMGLINLDEFDRLSPGRMAQLKNWMQMPALNIRKAYQKHFCQLPRIASFIGTSNRKDLLTDPTGSRRFLCIEVQQKIDCAGLDHGQIYAQLKAELETGKRYWFTSEDEREIQEHNKAFYRASPEEEIFRAHFRATALGEKGELLSLAEIVEILREKHKGILHALNLAKFGSALVASGVERVHTHYGNRYCVVRINEGCKVNR